MAEPSKQDHSKSPPNVTTVSQTKQPETIPWKTIIATVAVTTLATGLVLNLIPYLFGLAQSTNRELGEIKTKLAVLETKVDNIDRQVFRQYREKASALGIVNPQISLINLKDKQTNFTFRWDVNDRQTNDPLGYILLTGSVVAVEDESVLLEVDQQVFDYITMKDRQPRQTMQIRLPFQTDPPILLKFTPVFSGPKGPVAKAPPMILQLAIIDRPSPNFAVIAAGNLTPT